MLFLYQICRGRGGGSRPAGLHLLREPVKAAKFPRKAPIGLVILKGDRYMDTVKLKVLNADGYTRMASAAGEQVSLVYAGAYAPGDRIALSVSRPEGYYVIQLEDTLPETLVYITQMEVVYTVPSGSDLIVFSPKSFSGSRHLIRARAARPEEVAQRRNLALNPFDRHNSVGIFPHAEANVETRGEAVFAAYNAIDGIYENASHGEWPYQSWGINRDPKAEWTLRFGRSVCIDELRMTLRADFPHDSWWEEAVVEFSDGSREVLELKKDDKPQAFPIAPRSVEWLTLKELKKAEDLSPFPALTQFEAWGTEVRK